MTLSKNDLRILFVQVRERATADHEFASAVKYMGLDEDQFTRINLTEETLEPNAMEGFHAVVVGGSGEFNISRSEPKDQLEALKNFVQSIIESGQPFLGICYGAQLLAYSLGAKIVYAPDSKEVGTRRIYQAEGVSEDPFFTGIPLEFNANCGRTDNIVDLKGVIEMGHSDNIKHHVFRVPEKPIYGTHFHPELNQKEMRERLDYTFKWAYGNQYEEAGKDQIEAVQEADHAAQLLNNFIDYVVLPHWNR